MIGADARSLLLPDGTVFRYDVTPADAATVRRIVESTQVFTPAEVDVAVELVDERLAKGFASGYYFVFADRGGQTVAYTCYGPIAVTVGSYDLYWIAVAKEFQSQGWGRILMSETERLIRAEQGRRIYIETSTRDCYAPTRAFYQRCGYRCEAVIEDFYAPGDDKAIYVREV